MTLKEVKENEWILIGNIIFVRRGEKVYRLVNIVQFSDTEPREGGRTIVIPRIQVCLEEQFFSAPQHIECRYVLMDPFKNLFVNATEYIQ